MGIIALIIVIGVAISHGTTKSRVTALEKKVKYLQGLVGETTDPLIEADYQVKFKQEQRQETLNGLWVVVVLAIIVAAIFGFIYYHENGFYFPF